MICGGLVFIGLILHLCTGGLDWGSFAWPLNVYLAIVYVAVLVILYLVRSKVYFVRWAMSYQAAIPSLICGISYVHYGNYQAGSCLCPS